MAQQGPILENKQALSRADFTLSKDAFTHHPTAM